MHAPLKSYDLIKTFGASSRRGDAALARCTLFQTIGDVVTQAAGPLTTYAVHVRDRILRRAAGWLLHDLQARSA